MKSVLFVCTGNYYRSRCAEILFNHIATKNELPARAVSRGFRLNPAKNKGVLSPHATAWLPTLDIPLVNVGVPTALTRDDLEAATHIIVMDEKEHRPMMQQSFPDWEAKVEYWQLEDDYVVSPDIVLPRIRAKVETLIQHIHQSSILTKPK